MGPVRGRLIRKADQPSGTERIAQRSAESRVHAQSATPAQFFDRVTRAPRRMARSLRLPSGLRLWHIAIFAACPTPALADACAQVRPRWQPGTEVTLLSETLALATTPVSLALILASVICLRFRLQWATLGVVVAWTAWVSVLAFLPPGETRARAIAEGCVGSPALFIGLVAAICVAMILYTSPRGDQHGD